MNCPSRVDALFEDGYNQSPNALNADATTRADMDHMANARLRSDHCISTTDGPASEIELDGHNDGEDEGNAAALEALDGKGGSAVAEGETSGSGRGSGKGGWWRRGGERVCAVLRKYAKFVGPGFMVAVAYIDPGMLLLGVWRAMTQSTRGGPDAVVVALRWKMSECY
jgi:metal iron transporter